MIAQEQTAEKNRLSVCMLDLNSAVPYYDAYLCSALKRLGVKVRLAAISYYLDRECFVRCGVINEPPIDRVGRLNLPAVLRRPMKLVEIGANLKALESTFRKTPPDVLHVQYLPLVRLNLQAELAFLERCRTLRIPVAYTVHDVLPHDSGDKFRDIYTRLYKIPDLLICHSEAVRQELVSTFGFDDGRIRIIPHGPLFHDRPAANVQNFRQELEIPASAPVVLWQGIIHPYKGIDLLLDAWQVVRSSIPEAQLVIAGTGSAEILEDIRASILELGLTKSVKTCFRYLSVEDLLRAYAVTDVVVYPYRKVSTSGALLTGLALGKAIIATDLPFFRATLEDGALGQLVPCDAAALGSSIKNLLLDADERHRLERRVAEKHFGEDAWDDIARKTVGAYEQLLVSTSA